MNLLKSIKFIKLSIRNIFNGPNEEKNATIWDSMN